MLLSCNMFNVNVQSTAVCVLCKPGLAAYEDDSSVLLKINVFVYHQAWVGL